MPELPEVEAARRAIEDHCVGKKIVKAIIADDPKVIDGVSLDDFRASLEGKTIVAANRKGKNMWIELDSPPFPTFQFGMAGAIYIKGVAVTKYKRSAVKDDDEWPSKYSKVFLELDDGLELSFTDKRRFARVRSLKNPVSVPPISELGPDALLEPMTVDEFYKAFSKKKIGVKALLLDQSFISGIGNWIADEVLYQARIHPMQTASSISKEDCATLLKCIYEVTEFAVEVDADCSRFPSEWLFHYRWGKKPGKVNGEIIFHMHPHFDIRLYAHRSSKKLLKLAQIVVSILLVGFSIPGKRNLARPLLMGRKSSLSRLVAGLQPLCRTYKRWWELNLQKQQVKGSRSKFRESSITIVMVKTRNQKLKRQKLGNQRGSGVGQIIRELLLTRS
uniref:Formamidopyrimidine-DNA glycosylase isoform X3 n=1 Tax=Nicotiana tabacum TaxID=4097 RepID=A0A1S4D1M2_TOBAC|nr:PREDICTED: formamidopyrimidine-DNA glycosylase-like isoform X3 [Nicotiana tabacum]